MSGQITLFNLTALVNEAWLRLTAQTQPEFDGRSHFFAIAAHYMRQILVEYARRRQAQKRGSGERMVALHTVSLSAPERSLDILTLNEGLQALEKPSARQARESTQVRSDRIGQCRVAGCSGAIPRCGCRAVAVWGVFLSSEQRAAGSHCAGRMGQD